MNDFTVWDPDSGNAEEAGRTITSYDAESAAEAFVERDWEGEEFARVIHVMDGAGTVTRWSVLPVCSVDFRATEL